MDSSKNETILRANKEINGNGHLQWMRTQNVHIKKPCLQSFGFFLIICFVSIDAFCQIRRRSNKTTYDKHLSLKKPLAVIHGFC